MVKKRLDEVVRRRVQAGRLMLQGKTPAQTAQVVGVARQTAYVWKAVLSQGGIDACVFRKSVTGRFGIVTAEFGNVTDDFGDVTDGILMTA